MGLSVTDSISMFDFDPSKESHLFQMAVKFLGTDCIRVLQVLFYSILLNPLLIRLTKDRLTKISSLTYLICISGEKLSVSKEWFNGG